MRARSILIAVAVAAALVTTGCPKMQVTRDNPKKEGETQTMNLSTGAAKELFRQETRQSCLDIYRAAVQAPVYECSAAGDGEAVCQVDVTTQALGSLAQSNKIMALALAGWDPARCSQTAGTTGMDVIAEVVTETGKTIRKVVPLATAVYGGYKIVGMVGKHAGNNVRDSQEVTILEDSPSEVGGDQGFQPDASQTESTEIPEAETVEPEEVEEVEAE